MFSDLLNFVITYLLVVFPVFLEYSTTQCDIRHSRTLNISIDPALVFLLGAWRSRDEGDDCSSSSRRVSR